MQQTDILRRLMLSASVTAVLAAAGLPASAQTATTTAAPSAAATATSKPQAGNLATAATAPKGAATSQMAQEACQRQRIRTQRFLQSGVPEQFGSEEPFTFDPKSPCS